jgi:energy-coupling factor transporter ATP-binding protein EcfA2
MGEGVSVYAGHSIANPSERAFLTRLRSQLPAGSRVIANFFPVGAQGDRQIDFFVDTPFRSALVELKSFRPTQPLTGLLNGSWHQQTPTGQVDVGNPVRQVLDCRYALSDSMRALRHCFPDFQAATYRDFDSFVCFSPRIPDESTYESHSYVHVVGEAELMEALVRPGRRLPWASGPWQTFLTFQGVYPFDDVPHEPGRSQDVQAELAHYRDSLTSHLREGLHELVTLPALVADVEVVVPVDRFLNVSAGEVCIVAGRSGAGKSHLVRHAAIRALERGSHVIWARSGEYEAAELGTLLARSAAPFTTLDYRSLIGNASTQPPLVIFDGLSGAPSEPRLLEQIAALCLRHAVAVIITATYSAAVPGFPTIEMVLPEPNGEGLAALRTSYNVEHSGPVTTTLTSPFEIATLAAVSRDLPANATAYEVHEAFITDRASAQAVRVGLRELAARMVAEIRTSLRRTTARSLLERRPDLTPSEIDAVLDNGLLTRSQGFVSFTHDLHRDLLAGEHICSTAGSAVDFVEFLADPRNRDLRGTALSIVTDQTWITNALVHLAESELFVAAANGRFGAIAEQAARNEIGSRITLAVEDLRSSPAHFAMSADVTSTTLHDGRWVVARPPSSAGRAALAAAGHLFAQGEFVTEMMPLIDAIDDLVAEAIDQLRRQGRTNPVSISLAATYVWQNDLPIWPFLASLRWYRASSDPDLLLSLVAPLGPARWTRLFVALRLANVSHGPDAIVSLIGAAWKAGGYHLRLEALECTRRLVLGSEALTQRLADLVETFDVSTNVFLSTGVVEILSAAGRIDTGRTVSDIQAEIAELLIDPDNATNRAHAYGIYATQFEDVDLGPYAEAIETIDESSKRRFLVMAANTSDGVWLSVLLTELTAFLPAPDVASVFRRHAMNLPPGRFMAWETMNLYLTAARGWAQVADRLPIDESKPLLSDDERAWQLVAGLIHHLERAGESPYDIDGSWKELLGTFRNATPDVLKHVVQCPVNSQASLVSTLIAFYPEHLAEVASYALDHPTELTSAFGRALDLRPFAIGLLEACGGVESISRLLPLVSDQDLGRSAVAAIQSIRVRTET